MKNKVKVLEMLKELEELNNIKKVAKTFENGVKRGQEKINYDIIIKLEEEINKKIQQINKIKV